MQCPTCKENMRSTERLGILMDQCPVCRGVWLSPVELDKLWELTQRAGGVGFGGPSQRAYERGGRDDPHVRRSDSHSDSDDDYRDHRHESDHGHESEHGHGGHRRKRGVLGNLFDMFGD